MEDLRHEYLKKFGPNSLDRVIIADPLDREACRRVLRNAIDTNTPLPQIDKELWDIMLF